MTGVQTCALPIYTTSTALEWIMANMVKYPQIQERLLVEIKGVVGDGEKEVKKRI